MTCAWTGNERGAEQRSNQRVLYAVIQGSHPSPCLLQRRHHKPPRYIPAFTSGILFQYCTTEYS